MNSSQSTRALTIADTKKTISVPNDLTDSDRSLDAVERTLANHDRQYTSRPASPFSIRVNPDHLTVGDDNFVLDAKAWGALATSFHATQPYWMLLEPDFRSTVAQYHFDHLHHLSSGQDSIDIVAVNGRFLCFRPSHLLHLGSSDVLRAIRHGLDTDAEHFTLHRIQVTEESVSVELVTRRMTQVETGDDIQGGIAFSHSAVGSHPTTVDLFTLRLVCQNGLTLRRCVGRTEISRGRRLKDRGECSIIAAMNQIERMTRERITHMSELLQSFTALPRNVIAQGQGATAEDTMRHFLMPQLRATHLWSDILWTRVLAPAWQHEHGGRGELTEFAAVNTITYVASHHKGLTFRQRRTLARLAGLLAYRRVHVCSRCHQAVIAG